MPNTMTPQQRAALLSAYAPYGLLVQFPEEGANTQSGKVEFLDYSVEPPHVSILLGDSPHRRMAPVTMVRPVLYSLAELPHLPGEQLARVAHLMDIVASEDRGAGEYVSSASVINASAWQVHLAVTTGYTYPDTSYFNEYDELVEPDPPTDEEVAQELAEASDTSPSYEVIIGARGDIDWRCIPYEQGKREPFRPLRGDKVLEVVEYLQGLHVAIGAWMHIGEARYVLKVLPVQQEGGQAPC